MNPTDYILRYALIYFVIIFDWYHSPCFSWDPPNVDDLGRVALLGRGATIVVFTSRFVVLASPLLCGGKSHCRALKEVLVVTSVRDFRLFRPRLRSIPSHSVQKRTKLALLARKDELLSS